MRGGAQARRYGDRDGTMILLAFRPGLRVSELVALRWEQVLGHRQIANTARYTKMDARRFDGFWQD